jgi:hypothetical protein
MSEEENDSAAQECASSAGVIDDVGEEPEDGVVDVAARREVLTSGVEQHGVEAILAIRVSQPVGFHLMERGG